MVVVVVWVLIVVRESALAALTFSASLQILAASLSSAKRAFSNSLSALIAALSSAVLAFSNSFSALAAALAFACPGENFSSISLPASSHSFAYRSLSSSAIRSYAALSVSLTSFHAAPRSLPISPNDASGWSSFIV